MHELSLCGAIIDTVADHLDGRTVSAVNVKIGHFRQVVPETLQFCWSARTEGTVFEGCALVIDHVPATISCRGCGADTVLAHPVLRCGACDSVDVALVTGEEFLIESIDLVSAEDPT